VPKASMSVLSKSDIEQVHQASLRILSEVGVKVDSPTVLELMAKAGAKVDRSKLMMFLHERMVSDALRSAPKKVRLCSRGGVDYEVPTEGVQLVSPDGQPPAIFDVYTMKKRPSVLKDVIDFAIVCDALQEVDFVWPPVVATDMPSDKSSSFEFLATIAYTAKHVQHGAISEQEADFQIEVASAILGSGEALRERPIFSDVITPISPLRYDKGEAEALVVLSRSGVPIVHLSMAIAGAVTPVTIAGSLAVVNAENLCGLTMSQVASRGAPAIYSSFSGVSDLKTGVFLCGTPEGVLMDVGATEMARYYGLPSCAGGPANASRSLSAEAGYQSAITATASMLAGADLMVGLGGLDRDAMGSLEKLVIDCEVWRWLERLRAGVSVDDATIGLDAIRRQGPGGTFLSDPHTLRFMRKDLLVPQITAYHRGGEPNYASDELIEYAKRRVKEILANHRPPLLQRDTAKKVGRIAKKYGIVHRDGKQIFEHA